jgi:hypothetical protein
MSYIDHALLGLEFIYIISMHTHLHLFYIHRYIHIEWGRMIESYVLNIHVIIPHDIYPVNKVNLILAQKTAISRNRFGHDTKNWRKLFAFRTKFLFLCGFDETNIVAIRD